MGYPSDRFIDPVDRNLFCGICSMVFEQAVLTPCGHAFCELCLSTWRGRYGNQSCPECRSDTSHAAARPILAVRSLIGGLRVHCCNRSRGCCSVVRAEAVREHEDACGFAAIECAACFEEINRVQLPAHQLSCIALQVELHGEESQVPMVDRAVQTEENRCLERHLARLRSELDAARATNQQLYRQLELLVRELERAKKSESVLSSIQAFTDTDLTLTSDTLCSLGQILLQFRADSLSHVDQDRLFGLIRRIYLLKRNGSLSVPGDHVHMVLAVASVCRCFSSDQRQLLRLWSALSL